jgi:collagenase-like PrtC family protease
LAPIPYYWEKEAVYAFYETIRDTPVDVVYLGETVCARRHQLRLGDWLDIGARLRDSGKNVVLSTQILLESESSLTHLRQIAENDLFTVEANDIGAVRLLAGKKPFIAGSYLNIYHARAVALLREWGATRWVVPVETSRADMSHLLSARPEGMEMEVLGYGRLPLAFSARCFTARHHNLPKEDCRFGCLSHRDGLSLKTREQEDFLVINGTQVLSGKVYTLLHEIPVLEEMGVNVLRINPQSRYTPEIIGLFSDAVARRIDVHEAGGHLQAWLPALPCNGYWHGLPGMTYTAPMASMAK